MGYPRNHQPKLFWKNQWNFDIANVYIYVYICLYIYTLYIHILAYIYICMYVEHYTQNLGPREGDPSRGRWKYIYIINICIWDTDICQLINHKLIVNTVNSSQKSSETHISNRKSSTYMAQWQKLCGLIPTPGSTFIWVNHWLRPGSENIFGIGLWNLP
jgi:hypothetical protein